MLCVAVATTEGTGLAIPVSTPPPAHRPGPVTPAPSPIALQSLAFDSSLLFVLDDAISSEYSKTGDLVKAHLRDPLIVNGVTVAPAGTAVSIRIMNATRAKAGDEYGSVDIAFLPLHLPDGQVLPLRAPTAHLAPWDTVGHESTVGVEEGVSDIFLPVGMLYAMVRKGRNITLGVGSMIRARTVATVTVEDGLAIVATPQPIQSLSDVPASSYRGLPFVALPSPVPGRGRQQRPHPSPSPQPSASAGDANAMAMSAPSPAAVSPMPQGSEVAFVQYVQSNLLSRFATASQAENAGFFRYTNADKTGSISYVDLSWTSDDPSQPSQLWYDAGGNLLGADYSEPYSEKPPEMWGVNPARWSLFGAHFHYVYVDATGTTIYGKATSAKAFLAAGGDAGDPQPDTLVKMGLVPNAAAVKQVFLFPRLWDLQVWVKPNPNGAFAEMNPDVTTSTPTPAPTPAIRSTSSP
jgi:hypothetical protein